MGVSRVGRGALLLAMVGLLLAGGALLQLLVPHGPQLMFWVEGESWTQPTRCLKCGGQLEPTGNPWHQCASCGANIVIAQPEATVATRFVAQD
jgi:hypothetical protein